MIFSKKILFLLFTVIICSAAANADDIQISSFNELITSSPENGDTLTLIDNLTSDSSIGRYFENLDISFEGDDHYINGNNVFSGFNLNSDTNFNRVDVRNCRGQRYGGYSYAGAIYNDGGELSIVQSSFNENFVNSNGLNLGSGGAIYNINGGNVNLDSVVFENNYTNGASSYGGAIANDFTSGTETILTINNSVFKNNYSDGSVLPTGGAIYNSGQLNISNTTFDNNKTLGEESFASYGGVLYNTGTASFKNSNIINNSSSGGNMSIVRGGAIYNSSNLSLENTKIDNNYVDAMLYGDGGAIYNSTQGNIAIKNSIIENNYTMSDSGFSEGGGIANEGTITIENTTLKNNYNLNSSNDIYNYETGIINFDGVGTTNILSGIEGSGSINKRGSGILNLGGINDEFTGIFSLEEGTLNLLGNSSYFSAQKTNLNNNTNFNMENNEINSINFGDLTLSGKTNILADINLNTGTMDNIKAEAVTGSGIINISSLSIKGSLNNKQDYSIPFANSVLKDFVQYSGTKIETPIYNYSLNYNSSDGNLNFSRQEINSSAYIPSVSAQISGYLNQIDVYKNVFSNLDMVMIASNNVITGIDTKNKTASTSGILGFSPGIKPEERNGIWFKPYTTFENVPLKGATKVSNVSYGTIVGAETEIIRLKKGWYSLYGGYISYNGSHQSYDGNSIYNNGGLLGVDAAFYKKGFFSAWTLNTGANTAEASSAFGKQDFVMLNAGIAEKTGYNFEIFDRKLIFQPSFIMSYTFVNTFNYNTDYDIGISSEPLHAIHVEPQIKVIGNFKNYVQPYAAVSMVWNIMDKTHFCANDVYLPELSVKPFVEYGAGIQKRYGERLTGFIESKIRNGGRNGIVLRFGVRISI